MKITREFLIANSSCEEGIKYYDSHQYIHNVDHDVLIKHLAENGKFLWAAWLITRILSTQNNIKFAVYSAELVLPIFEEKYPDDTRPRLAIEATKKYLNTASADAGAYIDAFSAASSASSAAARSDAYAASCDGADAAAYAAYTAAYTASSSASSSASTVLGNSFSAVFFAAKAAANAAYSAFAASDFAADYASRAASDFAYDAAVTSLAAFAAYNAFSVEDASKIELQLIEHGLKLIEDQEKKSKLKKLIRYILKITN